MKKLSLTVGVALLFCIRAEAQMASQFLDPRDGQSYATVIMKYKSGDGVTLTKEWFSQNLNYNTDRSYCYKGEEAYCEVFGRLYLREASTDACPAGWHIPTSAEWQTIIDAHGGLKTAGAMLNEGGDAGLNLQMGGFGDKGEHYQGIGASGYYWAVKGTSSELITIDASTDEILYDPIGNANKNSIRCLRD